MPTLSEKLKSLGVKIGSDDLPPPRKKRKYPIEEIVEGHLHDTPFGQTFIVETRYPKGYRHGLVELQLESSLAIIADWANDPRVLKLNSREYIFLDIETSGLAGGAGTYAFLIGVGYLDRGGFHLAQFFMRDPIEEPAQLAALTSFLGNCKGLVTFNGRSFDVPIVNNRYITNRDISPFKSTLHIDLLPLARRLWRDRLPSRKLGYLEEHILRFKRGHEDVPGWLVPSLYFDYLRTGDARPLQSVFYHNAMDILSMVALLNHITHLLENPLNGAVTHATDIIAIGKLFDDLGHSDMAATLYSQGLEMDLPYDVWLLTTRRWSFLEKRRENLSTAVKLWEKAAERKEIYAHIELAKFYEHRKKEYQEAIRWTEAAIRLLKSTNFSLHMRHHLLPELEHRLARLQRKNARWRSSK